MEGWLEKQGTVFKTWKRRWCVLYKDGDEAMFFRYYTSEDKSTEKGFFRIAIDSSISSLEDGYGGGKKTNMFVLQAAGNKNKAICLASSLERLPREFNFTLSAAMCAYGIGKLVD